ncbi:MAG: hypothetical protein ACJ8EF_04555 [Bradyrhizobium sp.]|jgi:hypothetical protein
MSFLSAAISAIRTMLARISPVGRDYEVRSFESPETDHDDVEQVVAPDPFEGWLTGDLKPEVKRQLGNGHDSGQ